MGRRTCSPVATPGLLYLGSGAYQPYGVPFQAGRSVDTVSHRRRVKNPVALWGPTLGYLLSTISSFARAKKRSADLTLSSAADWENEPL